MTFLCWFQEFNIKFCVVGCVEFGTNYYVFIYTHNWELMKLSGKSWQLVTIIHKEGDGQILCE
jgi:hypothetical protein